MEIKKLPTAFFNNINDMSQHDVAYVVLSALLGSEFSSETLRNIVMEWLEWESDLKWTGDNICAYEPLQGPTMSCYDVMARLAALLVKYRKNVDVKVSVDKIFCCARQDSAAAVGKAFMSVMGKSPVIFQSTGSLTELEKRQLYNIVPCNSLYIVGCDEGMLARLCEGCKESTATSRDDVTWIDYNCEAFVTARVFMNFDAYRLLKNQRPEVMAMYVARGGGDDVNGCDKAVDVAMAMGLPLHVATSDNHNVDVDSIIAEAYKLTGYILCPEAAMAWNRLRGEVRDERECGVFVQGSHPAKFRSRLELLINRVIMLPHKLRFGDHFFPRYKYIAPTVNSIKACMAINN